MAIKSKPGLGRSIVKVGAPIVAVLTLMLGLRIGAGESVRAAVVFAGPPGRPAPNGKTRIAWQILTFLYDRGVKETIPMTGLTVVARSKGHEATWRGASNGDGIAEMALEIEGLEYGDDLDMEVRVADEKDPIAAGRVVWAEPRRKESAATRSGSAARPTVRSGVIGVDVVIEGDRLIAGFPTSLWVRATPPPGLSPIGLVVEAAPEPGLVPEREKATTCGAGWAELPMTAMAHVTGVGFDVHRGAWRRKPDPDAAPNVVYANEWAGTPGRGPDGGLLAVGDAGAEAGADSGANLDAGVDAGVSSNGPTGRWFGALPVAPGAFFISMPRAIQANVATHAVLIAPNPRDVVYAELDDVRGRVVAAALALKVEPGDATPRARFELPPLAPGLYWLVVSGEPRGAEHLAGAAVAKTIVVGDGTAGLDEPTNVLDACDLGPYVAQRPAAGFSRWVALDGLPARSASNVFRHRLGLGIGLVSLLAAAILETLLLIAASREARVALQLAELDEDDPAANKVTARPPGGSLVMALLIVILGLALLGVLLMAKG